VEDWLGGYIDCWLMVLFVCFISGCFLFVFVMGSLEGIIAGGAHIGEELLVVMSLLFWSCYVTKGGERGRVQIVFCLGLVSASGLLNT